MGATVPDPCVGVGGLYCNSEDWHSWDRVIEVLRGQLIAANALLASLSFDPETPGEKQATRVRLEIATWVTVQTLRESPPSDPEAFVKGAFGFIVYGRATRKARDAAVKGCKILGRAAAVLLAAGAGDESEALGEQLSEWSELGKLAAKGLTWETWAIIGVGAAGLATFVTWRLGLLRPRRRSMGGG